MRELDERRVSVVLPADVYERLQKYAYDNDRSMAAVIRLAVRQYLGKRRIATPTGGQ